MTDFAVSRRDFIRNAALAGTAAPAQPMTVAETADAIEVTTGGTMWRIGKRGAAIIQRATVGGRETLRDVKLLATSQDGPDTDDGGAGALARYTSEITRTTVEQKGPVRAVVRVEGVHRGSGRDWLPFSLRLYIHAGSRAVRIVHSFIFDGDPDKDFIRGLGLTGAVPMQDRRTIAMSALRATTTGYGVKRYARSPASAAMRASPIATRRSRAAPPRPLPRCPKWSAS